MMREACSLHTLRKAECTHAAAAAKAAKVEMRQPPKLSTATDELKGQLQRVFGLTSAPVDAAEKLHRAVSDRMQSWAFGDERSLTYLLNCFGRLGAAFPTAAQAIANASGGTGGAVSPQIAQAEADCFPLAVLLHHARAILLSGEAHDDGLGLFQEGGASDSSSPAYSVAASRTLLPLSRPYTAPCLRRSSSRCTLRLSTICSRSSRPLRSRSTAVVAVGLEALAAAAAA